MDFEKEEDPLVSGTGFRPLIGLLSIVVPAHNEQDNIGGVLSAARAALPGIAQRFEVVLVDDGSSDATTEVARNAMGDHAGSLRIIRHEQKRGYGLSVAEGLAAATGDFVAFMDGDAQFDPADLRILAARIGGADLVAGARVRRADPRYRLAISGVFNVLVRALYGINYRDVDCGMKLMRRSFLDGALPLQARSALLNTELFYKAKRSGVSVVQVPVPHYPRVAGVRSGARLLPILRAVRELVLLRFRLSRNWRPILPATADPL